MSLRGICGRPLPLAVDVPERTKATTATAPEATSTGHGVHFSPPTSQAFDPF